MYDYSIRRGDTLSRIARRFGISVESLAAANPRLRSGSAIAPGQRLRIPAGAPGLYVVQPGDTLLFIAQRFNIAPDDLLQANPGVDASRLLVGSQLVLPAGRPFTIIAPYGPYGFCELEHDLRLLTERYPAIGVSTIGRSVLGKPLYAAHLGRGSKEVLYNAAFHANEWITTPLLMRFLEEAAAAYAGRALLRGREVARLLDECKLWLVPMVNPDGVELVQESVTPQHPYYHELMEWNNGSFNFGHWKANVRGVDLNDQFPAHWETERARRSPEGPGPRDYAGTAPLTEPEAAAMAAFTRARNFRLVIALHTQGREIYWNYRDCEPEEAEPIAARFARVSGYRPVKLTGSDAGYKDWFIHEFGRPGFTVEAGVGVNPLPAEAFDSIYEEVVGIMLEGLSV